MCVRLDSRSVGRRLIACITFIFSMVLLHHLSSPNYWRACTVVAIGDRASQQRPALESDRLPRHWGENRFMPSLNLQPLDYRQVQLCAKSNV